MYLELEEYVAHKEICVERKRNIEAEYEEVMKQTSPNSFISTVSSAGDEKRNINTSIVDAKISFKNFIMYALYGTKKKWAKSDVIVPLLRKEYQNTGSSETFEKVIQKYKDKLNLQTDDVFEYILSSNYEKEIGKAISDWGELGTGCFEYKEHTSDKVPFSTRYVPLNELLFNEDVEGNPSIVFRYHFSYNYNELKSLFPKANLECLELKYGKVDKIKQVVTVIECVMPHYDKDGTKTFECLLFDENMEHVLERNVKTYNPYTIFRFSSYNNTCWGMGIGILCSDSYERLNYYENLRARQSARIVEPPIGIVGDKAIAQQMNFDPNAVNWLGDGQVSKGDAFTINTTGTLLPTNEDITRHTQTIQQLHFNNPFGSAENKTTRAVEEVQYRMQLLQQKFSDAVANLYQEVLIPSFMKPKLILEKKGIVGVIDENRFFKPKFVNLLTLSVDRQKVENIISAHQIVSGLFPNDAPFVLKKTETINKVYDSLDIEKTILVPEEEREATKNQAMQQMMAQQQQEQQQK